MINLSLLGTVLTIVGTFAICGFTYWFVGAYEDYLQAPDNAGDDGSDVRAVDVLSHFGTGPSQ